MTENPFINCPVLSNSRHDPLGIAIRSNAGEWTWREFEGLIEGMVRLLLRQGLNTGDTVALLSGNSVAYAAAIFATLRLRLVLVPLNLRLGSDYWHRGCEICDPRLLMVDRERRSFAIDSGRPWLPLDEGLDTPHTDGEPPLKSEMVTGNSPRAGDEADAAAEIDPDTDAFIFFTSGSSGEPRGVISSFGNHRANALASNRNLPLAPGDCWLLALPLFHVGGLGILLRAALAGAAVHLQDSFDPAAARELITRGEVTHLSVVPAMLRDLLSVAGEGITGSSLKGILLGGAPAGRSLLERCRHLRLPVLSTYGMTETASQITTLPPGAPSGKLRTTGKPLAGIELQIAADPAGALPPGEAGEIMVRGETLCRGYITEEPGSHLNDDGWFPTGDLGRLDGDGYLEVLGRRDRMFISGGENIHPDEIERVAAEYPGILECAVVAAPHPRWGRRPVLVVLPEPESQLDPEQLQSHLQSRLPKIMRPEKVVVVERFPRLATGKIDLRELASNLDSGSE